MKFLLDNFKKIQIAHKWLILSLFLFIDSYIGLKFGSGLLSWTNIPKGDILWILQSLEMMAFGMIIVNRVVKNSSGKFKALALISTPVFIFLLVLFILDTLLKGQGTTTVFYYNLSSISLSALYWSAAYMTVAVGLTLTYKVQRYGNFAQAEIMLLGSYVALIMMWSDMFSPISDASSDGILDYRLLVASAISAFVICGFVGVIIDKSVYKPLRKRFASAQVLMITSLGVAMVIRGILYMRFSARTFRFIPDKDWRLLSSNVEVPTQRVDVVIGSRIEEPFINIVSNVGPYGFSYSKIALVVGILIAISLLMLIMHKTILGKKMRAVSDNPDLASTSGINVENIHSTSSFLSAGISGLGGALLAAILPVSPELGLSLLLPAFAVIVLGSITSIPGVIIAAFIIGSVRAISEPLLIGAGNALDRPTASGFAEVMPFMFLIGVLLLMPSGLGNALHEWNVNRSKNLGTRKHRSSFFIADLLQTFSRFVTRILNLGIQKLLLIKSYRLFLIYITQVKSYILDLYFKITTLFHSYVGTALNIIRWPMPKLLRIDKETNRGSWIFFGVLLFGLILISMLLPSVTYFTKVMQLARIVALLGIFSLLGFSLNIHSGFTGMTNFGVIFFAGIGAVFVGILSAPIETNGYGWGAFEAAIFAVLLAAVVGWLIAYPTARLRTDYFAIVTISLGEILRVSLQAEPLLRAGTVTSAMGISNYELPFKDWWNSGFSDSVGSFIGLPGHAPYVLLLATLSISLCFLTWWVISLLLSSPWGRILKSIREDEEVSQHHGHNIFLHKAASLALGAAIAALGGVLWAWLNTAVWPDFMSPIRSTFLIWAAFIVGGKGNNKGMFIGAFIIVIVEFIFNVMVVSRTNSDLIFHSLTTYIDKFFGWILYDLGGLIWSERSIIEAFPKGTVILELSYLKVALIGLVIIVALRAAPKGLLPEIPFKPKLRGKVGENE
jgi:branched-chain amino acid transport system permease protein